MISNIFEKWNWKSFDIDNPEHRKMLQGRLQSFVALPNRFVPTELKNVQSFMKAREELRKAQIQAFSTTGDFPASVLEVFQKFHIATDYDLGYEEIFNVRDYSGSKRGGFDVLDVQSGLTFRRTIVGDKAKVFEMSGEKSHCYFDYYSGALGWHRSLFDDEEYWTMEDNAIEFRTKAYSARAQVFYSLIEAVGTAKGCCSVVPAGCSDCHADAVSIANSLNFAATTIMTNNRNKGYAINPATTQMIVLSPLAMSGRVKAALNVTLQAYPTSPTWANFSFRQITSLMLTSPTRVFVILPKNKLLAGYRMDLTLFSAFDQLAYTDTTAGWMRFGGCVGDLDQIECIDFEALSGSCPT